MFKNGAIPFQIHLHELNHIIKRQKNKFSFLDEKVNESDKLYKLETLMKFRIPYYVGPLKHGKLPRTLPKSYRIISGKLPIF